MNKTKIEWCDSTWNPVTGCLHDCPYCYARTMVHRFGSKFESYGLDPKVLYKPYYHQSVLDDEFHRNPYPYGFAPTLHKYRFDEYKDKAGRNIFVCSMADLFGDWVPEEWIQEVFTICNESRQHNYLFLTKNPERYLKLIRSPLDYKKNRWFGTTITNNEDMSDRGEQLYCHKINSGSKIFLSMEPLHEAIDPRRLNNVKYVDWVIIGAETGKQKGKIIPRSEWVVQIAETCKENGIPVFMKESLVPIIGERNMLREFPEGLKR